MANLPTVTEKNAGFANCTHRMAMETWPAYAALESVLVDVDTHLDAYPGDVDAHVLRARMLRDLARYDEAFDAYRTAANLMPAHVAARLGLAAENLRRGRRREAMARLEDVLADVPAHPEAAVLLAQLLDVEHMDRAYALLVAVLEADPAHRGAHEVLCALFAQLGDEEAAALHRELAFAGRACVAQPYRGRAWPRRALALVSTDGGNLELEPLVPNDRFAVTRLYVEAFDERDALPPHDVLVNGIADADVHLERFVKAARICARSAAPVLNHPARVARTGRIENAVRLGALDHVRTARTVPFSADAPSAFPFLLRAAGFHMGRYFERIDDASHLEGVLAAMPPVPLLAIELLDTRSTDGLFRKYRTIAVRGCLYPLHLAIGTSWRVHYFSSAMEASDAYRDEERSFLTDPVAVLGPIAWTALERVAASLDLEYCGIDFALDRRGDIIIFEANPAMTVILPPDDDERFAYRVPATQAVLRAMRELGEARSG